MFGMVERGGNVPRTSSRAGQAATLARTSSTSCFPSPMVYTDECAATTRLPQRSTSTSASTTPQGLRERKRPHADHRRLLVAGEARMRGTHHSVSAKCLQGYLNEYVWRYNHRERRARSQFALLLLRAASPSIRLDGLIARGAYS